MRSSLRSFTDALIGYPMWGLLILLYGLDRWGGIIVLLVPPSMLYFAYLVIAAAYSH